MQLLPANYYLILTRGIIMKNKFTARLCVFMCLVLIMSTFAACSIKKDDDSSTTTASVVGNNDSWNTAGGYEPVTITDVELVQLVSEALGDEAAGFNGDLSTLTPEQLEKVEDLAADKGLIVEKDENNNTVIKKEEIPTTQVTPEEYSRIMNQVSVSDPNNLTPEEYEELSKVADQNGMAVVTNPDTSEVQIVKPVTTTKISTPVATNASTAFPTIGPALTTNSAGRTTAVYNPPTQGYIPPVPTTVAPVSTLSSAWVDTSGGTAHQVFVDSETVDGGVVAVGVTFLKPDGTPGGKSSGIIVKHNENGKVLWTKIIGGGETVTDDNNTTSFESVAVLKDGSIVAVGYTQAQDVTGATDADYKCKGTIEGLVVKFSSKGELLWTKLYGGSKGDMIYSVAATPDGGFVIGGKAESDDADLKNLASSIRKAFIFKCDANGNIQWKRALSGSKHNAVQDMAVTSAGDIYVDIECISGDGEFAEIEGTQTTKRTTVVLKLDSNGTTLWQKALHDSGATNLHSIVLSSDGGCVVAGQYSSASAGNSGSFKGLYNGGDPGTYDGMIVKFNSDGSVGWLLPLIGFESDFITGITKIDGGYAVSGYTTSTNRDFSINNKGDYDTFVYTLNDYGTKRNIYSLGGSQADNARGICSDGSSALYLCGSTNSGDGYFANCSIKGTESMAAGFVCRFDLG